ncbi:MAG: hypothetical protein EAZ81_00045 [Verrucomicrobia bacterium]|nr:MAG: hypothetical protein EAZ81_00045 [Verrucomicrobiota bacterium]
MLQAIYMAALSASRYNPILKASYQNLLAKGKPKKVIDEAAFSHSKTQGNHAILKKC